LIHIMHDNQCLLTFDSESFRTVVRSPTRKSKNAQPLNPTVVMRSANDDEDDSDDEEDFEEEEEEESPVQTKKQKVSFPFYEQPQSMPSFPAPTKDK